MGAAAEPPQAPGKTPGKTPDGSAPGGGKPGRMRADALRNRRLILDAARDVFIEAGPDAPLDEIARRAGVGIATLYRRFPDRDALIRGVVMHTFTVLSDTVRAVREEAADPFDALRRFMHVALDEKIGAAMPALVGRVVFDDELDNARLGLGSPVEELLREAQAAGLVRPDVAFGDITLMVIRLCRPLPAVAKLLVDDRLAHRQLDIYLDGLRSDGTPTRHSLPPPLVTLADFDRIRAELHAAHEDENGSAPE